jgi:putative FmdB family regulatory protein
MRLGKALWGLVKEILVVIVVVAVAVVAFLVLRTPPSDVRSAADLEMLFGAGRPVLVELYANTWSRCLLVKPVVDRLQRDLGDEATVVRLDVRSPLGRVQAVAQGVSGVPAFILYASGGPVIYRQFGWLDTERVRGLVRERAEQRDPWVEVWGMPIYEYRCDECGEKFEKLLRMAACDKDVACPKCDGKKVVKQISLFGFAEAGSAHGQTSSSGGGSCANSGGFTWGASH